jgi:hypothetical protein
MANTAKCLSLVVLFTLTAQASPLNVFTSAGAKCSPNKDAVVAPFTAAGTCATGQCKWSVSLPLGNYCGRAFNSAVAYLSGWRFEATPSTVGFQTHVLEIGITGQSVTTPASGPQLNFTVVFEADARSAPELYGHDGDTFEVRFEVLAFDSSDIAFTGFTQRASNPGGTVSIRTSLNVPIPFAVAPIQRFRIESIRSTTATGALNGNNYLAWGIRTTNSAQSGANGLDTTTDCFAEGDAPAPSLKTSCVVERVSVWSKHSIARAISQPSLSLTAALSPTNNTISIHGVGAGSPLCGLGTFFFQSGGPTGFKARQLGFAVPDCDGYIWTSQSSISSADGRYCAIGGVSDQSPARGYSMPGCSGGNWSGYFELDTAGLQ